MFFKDVGDAIQWAERYAAKSNVKSQIGSLMKKGGGGLPVFDIAESISAKVSNCSPQVNGLALKCVYGEAIHGRDSVLGEMIGDYLQATNSGAGKTTEQLHRLGLVTVMAERALEVYGDRYPLKRMAYDVGISRTQFCTAQKWVEARADAVNVLRNWVASGKREMELWLDEHDWFDIGEVEESNCT